MQSSATPEEIFNEIKEGYANVAKEMFVMIDEVESSGTSSKSVEPVEETSDDDVQIIAEVKSTQVGLEKKLGRARHFKI